MLKSSQNLKTNGFSLFKCFGCRKNKKAYKSSQRREQRSKKFLIFWKIIFWKNWKSSQISARKMQAFNRGDLWTLLSIVKYLLVFLIFYRCSNVAYLKRLIVHKKDLISFKDRLNMLKLIKSFLLYISPVGTYITISK